MLVFYFTGTGNSLYVARELGGEHVISIPQALKNVRLAQASVHAETMNMVLKV